MNNLSRKLPSFFLFVIFAFSFSQTVSAGESGSWTKKAQTIHGTWSIVEKDDGHYLVLSEDFKTRKAPDLKLILSNFSTAEAHNKNALMGGVVIAPLKSAKGEQSYKLPDNFSEFQTLLLHCEKYSKLWGVAQLK